MKYLLALLTLLPLLAWSASFDCQKARSAPEKMVCANQELSRLDEQLDQTYRGALNTVASQVKADKTPAGAPSKLVKEQKHWITYQRNICTDAACLREVYQARIELLKREPSPFSDLYPTENINGQVISYPRDFDYEISSFNQSIIGESTLDANNPKLGDLINYNKSITGEKEPGKIIGCSKMAQLLSGGTVPNAYTAVGVCILQSMDKRFLVRICSNEIIGDYAMEKLDKDTTNISSNELSRFGNDKCGVGG